MSWGVYVVLWVCEVLRAVSLWACKWLTPRYGDENTLVKIFFTRVFYKKIKTFQKWLRVQIEFETFLNSMRPVRCKKRSQWKLSKFTFLQGKSKCIFSHFFFHQGYFVKSFSCFLFKIITFEIFVLRYSKYKEE